MGDRTGTVTGVVSTRDCPACGHHEVGILADDGRFYPLKPGTRIKVVEEPVEALERSPGLEAAPVEAPKAVKPWAPAPLLGDPAGRLKYGVLVQEGAEVDGRAYRTAYLQKLERLIGKEAYVPIAVTLDRFFTAPHLASGDSAEIAAAMWEDLDEIRAPAVLATRWIERPSEEVLEKMIAPRSKGELAREPVDEDQFRRELEGLALEEFLSLL